MWSGVFGDSGGASVLAIGPNKPIPTIPIQTRHNIPEHPRPTLNALKQTVLLGRDYWSEIPTKSRPKQPQKSFPSTLQARSHSPSETPVKSKEILQFGIWLSMYYSPNVLKILALPGAKCRAKTKSQT